MHVENLCTLIMMLQGLLSNVQNVHRNLHPVNENTMAVALKNFLAIEKIICLLF